MNKQALTKLAEVLEQNKQIILRANNQDLKNARQAKNDAFLDRMTLNSERYDDMIKSVEQIAALPNIIGERYEENDQPSGINVSKMRIPIGTILMIYESRPNVTIDAAALAIKTGNKIILKGGRETQATNRALAEAISKALKSAGLSQESVRVVEGDGREEVKQLLAKNDEIDLVIPRGSRKLLEYVRDNTSIPTLLHLEGNCHIYIDDQANLDMAISISLDAKTQRTGTCNTAESILVHEAVAKNIVPDLCEKLAEKGVEIRGDEKVCNLFKDAHTASEQDWSEEYLAPIVSMKVVSNIDEAIKHINLYGSGHTDAIVTENEDHAQQFLNQVDSSSVMHNTSTRLADGFEYGLGAEIGISTGKLHARGPVGQEGLTTYKWIVESKGVTKGGIVKQS